MLYTQTIKTNTYKLLNDLMNDNYLQNFNLVGGTALALYLGHRISIDIDLFTQFDFDIKELEEHLIINYNFQSNFLRNNTLKGTIDNIKIDCIKYSYPFVNNITQLNNLRIVSIEDIVAMKLSAIADNGTRVKDFFDIACASVKLSLEQMLQAYETKFPNSNVIRAIKGLQYYEDIDFSNEPVQMINGQFDWEQTQKRISAMVDHPKQIFNSFPKKLLIQKNIILRYEK